MKRAQFFRNCLQSFKDIELRTKHQGSLGYERTARLGLFRDTSQDFCRILKCKFLLSTKKDIVLGKEQGLFVLERRKNLVPVVQHRSNVVRMVDSLGQPLSTVLTLHVEEKGGQRRAHPATIRHCLTS
jgi:hypothetical protein